MKKIIPKTAPQGRPIRLLRREGESFAAWGRRVIAARDERDREIVEALGGGRGARVALGVLQRHGIHDLEDLRRTATDAIELGELYGLGPASLARVRRALGERGQDG